MFWWGFKIGRVWLWNRESLIGKKNGNKMAKNELEILGKEMVL